jgi:hypothetical protein
MNTASQQTVVGFNVKFVTFKEFLDAVATVNIKFNVQHYNCQIGTTSFEEDGRAEEVDLYSRRAVTLIRGHVADVALASLMPQLTLKFLFKRDLVEMVEEAAINSVENYGLPTHVVRLAPRYWMIANPEDFKLLKNGNSVALVCYAPNKNFAGRIDRMLEADFVKWAKQVAPEMSEEEIVKNARSGKP